MKVKICLDPGHGGHDPGACGSAGLTEAEVNLKVSQRLGERLGELGISTLLTRSSDVYIALGMRCELANDWGADYFISVHCNSDGPSAVGIETLYKTSDGKSLAEPIQHHLVLATGDTDRGLKYRYDLYVLNATLMPACLIELGFISHPQTESKLKTDDYQRLLAEAITAGLREFLNLAPAPAPHEHPLP